MLTVLDLFSGIGGFSLGLERTGGFKTIAFCEIDPFCRKVLAKHWPGVPCFENVCAVGPEQIASLGAIDLVCGGFPCQDVSQARRGGKSDGLDGDRSGLWVEIARIVGVALPTWILIENVHRLATAGLDRVLDELERKGYSCDTLVMGAGNAGAPHLRQRCWVVAHSAGKRREKVPRNVEGPTGGGARAGYPASMATAKRPPWADSPGVRRVGHGIPNRMDRVGSLGNAVVPQIPELIGRAILEAEGITMTRRAATTPSTSSTTPPHAEDHQTTRRIGAADMEDGE